MPKVTALAPERGGRVRVELDGELWRTLPAAAVAAAGLRVGASLDRARARDLRRALRRVAARDTAAQALARRDRSEAELALYLSRRGIETTHRGEAVEAMRSLGLVDDARFAAGRAQALSERGYGDEAIRWDLGERAVDPALIEEAVAALAPEGARARATAAHLGGGARAARALAAKGFSAEAIESALEVE